MRTIRFLLLDGDELAADFNWRLREFDCDDVVVEPTETQQTNDQQR